MNAKHPFIVCSALAVLAGPVAGQEQVSGVVDTDTDTTAAEAPDTVGQDETWTWFGMGFESRQQRRRTEGDAFGPSGRPRGGFGGSARSGRGGR